MAILLFYELFGLLGKSCNSIYERFHRIIQDGCYNISSLKDLQVDVDLWLRSYNQTRPHSANTATPI